MLEMYSLPGGKVCYSAGKKFVNDRLIELLEDVILEYVQSYDTSYMAHIHNSKQWEAPLEKIIDLNRLRADMDFAKEKLFLYLPDGYDIVKGLFAFFSLYDLLKAKESHKPELIMEYILFHLIEGRLNLCKDMPEIYSSIKHIPEPTRSQMLAEMVQELDVEDILEGYTSEDMIKAYEDLDKYYDYCFEDFDGLLLDEMSESDMIKSGFADEFGINAKETRVVNEYENIKFGIKLPEWMFEKS